MTMTPRLLCGDPRAVLERILQEAFPELEGPIMGGELLRRVRDLALEVGRVRATLETTRYAPPEVDPRTGVRRLVSERVAQMAIEHTHLTDEWSRRTFEVRPAAGRLADDRTERSLSVRGGQA